MLLSQGESSMDPGRVERHLSIGLLTTQIGAETAIRILPFWALPRFKSPAVPFVFGF